MIRAYKKEDIDSIMELWLRTNCSAHSFIAPAYWHAHYDAVKARMQHATVYVYEEQHVIHGFIGLLDTYIAGIFVSQKQQAKGIGARLLQHAKDKNNVLSLHVYKENERAVHFYLREGFTTSREQLDEHTGKLELDMHWAAETQQCAHT